MQETKEAVRYKLVLYREDEQPLDDLDQETEIVTTFHADNYLSREYIHNLRNAVNSIFDVSLTRHTKKLAQEVDDGDK